MRNTCDLLIVGGGPAGLCAAINGASEGLKVCLLDSGVSLGGQAKQSNSIENYPLPSGYPDGVTGQSLMEGFVAQAVKFNTDMFCPSAAAKLHVDGEHKVILTDDYQEHAARAVLLSIGLSYRRHPARGIGPLMGRGVFYGLPGGANMYTGKHVGVVGGANSAGQAVLKLAANKRTQVSLFVRKKLEDQMSTYLIERIRDTSNIEVCEQCDIVEVGGRAKLEWVHVERPGVGTNTNVRLDALFLFIGATPQTLWLQDTLNLDDKRFIATDAEMRTSIPGVFAAGDVRSGSTKRIAAAIGEGAAALQAIHRYLGAG